MPRVSLTTISCNPWWHWRCRLEPWRTWTWRGSSHWGSWTRWVQTQIKTLDICWVLRWNPPEYVEHEHAEVKVLEVDRALQSRIALATSCTCRAACTWWPTRWRVKHPD